MQHFRYLFNFYRKQHELSVKVWLVDVSAEIRSCVLTVNTCTRLQVVINMSSCNSRSQGNILTLVIVTYHFSVLLFVLFCVSFVFIKNWQEKGSN